jgi:hypothetical protein
MNGVVAMDVLVVQLTPYLSQKSLHLCVLPLFHCQLKHLV